MLPASIAELMKVAGTLRCAVALAKVAGTLRCAVALSKVAGTLRCAVALGLSARRRAFGMRRSRRAGAKRKAPSFGNAATAQRSVPATMCRYFGRT
jgi:predicted alpha/beta-hydrolase family hydrolase